MKFHVLTLFPDMVLNGLKTSIIGRAVENNFIEINAVDIRQFTTQKHGKVDDYTYGGGAGMLMQAEPVYQAWRSVVGDKRIRTVYVTPTGFPFTQEYAESLAAEEELVFLCGHYEGIDDRVLQETVTDYISIGDYVLTGGELPAMVMIDAVSRLVPGVLHNETSAQTESFHRNLLEYPQYTRPEVWRDKQIPQVLLGGDHKKVEQWRLEQSLKLTGERRPDLLQKYEEEERLIHRLAADKRQNLHIMQSIARGAGRILWNGKDAVVVYQQADRLCMVSVPGAEDVDNLMLEIIPKQAEKLVVSQERLVAFLESRTDYRLEACCIQACLTQKNSLSVPYKAIRLLTGDDRDALEELLSEISCTRSRLDEVREGLSEGRLFGACESDILAGIAGWFGDGSQGLLYVREAYRNKRIGSSLQAYSLNRQLEMGYTPYAQVEETRKDLLKLYEKLGLYLSRKPIWRMWRENRDVQNDA